MIRLVIADDHAMFRAGLRKLLEDEPGYSIAGEAASGAETVQLVRALQPDVLLLDLAMPGMSGLDALREIANAGYRPHVVLLTASIESAELVAALQLGAHGVVFKESASGVLVEAIGSVMAGGYWIGTRSASGLTQAIGGALPAGEDERYGLTPREHEIVLAIVAALSNREIADRLGISEKTVKHHLTNIFEKTGVSSRFELALLALRRR
jgi:DNA-binding NarL/FixJ family response regulator